MGRKHRGRPANINHTPKPRAFSAPPCQFCPQLRPPNTNYSRVYATLKKNDTMVRYIRCHFCNNAWVIHEQIPNNTSMENTAQNQTPDRPKLENNTGSDRLNL